MFVVGNLFIAAAKVLDAIFTMFYYLILIRALMSWVNPDPFNQIVQFFYKMTDPILDPIRRNLLRRFPQMVVDVSPLIAILAIYFLQRFLVETLVEIGYRMH